jgi:hypothetical protein
MYKTPSPFNFFLFKTSKLKGSYIYIYIYILHFITQISGEHITVSLCQRKLKKLHFVSPTESLYFSLQKLYRSKHGIEISTAKHSAKFNSFCPLYATLTARSDVRDRITDWDFISEWSVGNCNKEQYRERERERERRFGDPMRTGVRVQGEVGSWRMSSSGMWRRGHLVRTDVSGECIASIIRMEGISEKEKMVAVTSGWSTLWKPGDAFLRNVDSHKSHTASYPTRRHSS